jgi:predicted anti-sigma-YlaC factor YlaD
MHCSLSRELVSAALDGELAADERWLLDRHLDGCGECRAYVDRAESVHRNLRVQAAPPVPDLTAAVLARLDGAPATARRDEQARPAVRTSSVGWRMGLATVALLQLALAGPALIQHPDLTEQQYAVHHLNAWTVAFAVGLLVVAWQPWRVRGVLPIASALAGVMVFTVALDVHNNHAFGMPVTAHLLELAGLVLAWGLARQQRAAGDDRGSGGHGRPGRRGHTHRFAWLRPGGRLDAWARTPPAPAARSDRAA